MKELILRYADIDTRRALGVYRRLPWSDFVPRPIPAVSFRHWPEKKTVMYIEFGDRYEFTVYRDIESVGEGWSPCNVSSIWLNQKGTYSFMFRFEDIPFYFAGTPDVVSPEASPQTTEASRTQ